MQMDELIAGFTEQLREAMAIGRKAPIPANGSSIGKIVVSGLGGSGIGGNLVYEMVSEELTVPFEVNQNYSLPNYVDESTLVIVSSYSGNTEETLQSLELAIQRNARIICISSNGQIIDKAREAGYDFIRIPGGMPPRACLGYSFVQQLYVLSKLGLISSAFETALTKAIALLDQEEEAIKRTAYNVASQLHNHQPIIYAEDSKTAVAVRFRQQLNENSKKLAWHHVIPEMNHNELVGWRANDHHYAVVFLRSQDDDERNKQRIEINKEIIGQYTNNIREIWAKGASKMEQALYLIHVVDWVSLYLAEKRGMDPVEVDVIDYLKGELKKKA